MVINSFNFLLFLRKFTPYAISFGHIPDYISNNNKNIAVKNKDDRSKNIFNLNIGTIIINKRNETTPTTKKNPIKSSAPL